MNQWIENRGAVLFFLTSLIRPQHLQISQILADIQHIFFVTMRDQWFFLGFFEPRGTGLVNVHLRAGPSSPAFFFQNIRLCCSLETRRSEAATKYRPSSGQRLTFKSHFNSRGGNEGWEVRTSSRSRPRIQQQQQQKSKVSQLWYSPRYDTVDEGVNSLMDLNSVHTLANDNH